jgi:hypothetical protein
MQNDDEGQGFGAMHEVVCAANHQALLGFAHE